MRATRAGHATLEHRQGTDMDDHEPDIDTSDRSPSALRCLIVDDEAPARDEMRFLLDRARDAEVVGAAANAAEAGVLVDAIDYDVVFLDIHMPGIDGITFSRELRQRPDGPSVVFVTAYPDHAIEAFQADAVDYLLKPVDEARLDEALTKVARRRGAGRASSEPDGDGRGSDAAANAARRSQRIPVQRGDRTVFVNESDVVLASASRGYSHLQLHSERVLVNFTLADLEQRLSDSFVRVHRSHLVNLEHIRELRPDFSGGVVLVMADAQATTVKVARRQAAAIRRHLGMS